MKDMPQMLYATHGKKWPLGVKALIDNVPCIAYIKNEKLVAYEPWTDLQQQMLDGPYVIKYNTADS